MMGILCLLVCVNFTTKARIEEFFLRNFLSLDKNESSGWGVKVRRRGAFSVGCKYVQFFVFVRVFSHFILLAAGWGTWKMRWQRTTT